MNTRYLYRYACIAVILAFCSGVFAAGTVMSKGAVKINPKDGAVKKTIPMPSPAPVDLWGYIDRSGKTIIFPRFDDAFPFSEGLAAVRSHGKWGFIDRNGKWVIKPRFDNADRFSEGLAAVNYDQSWYVIDKTGKTVLPSKAKGTWSTQKFRWSLAGPVKADPKVLAAETARYGWPWGITQFRCGLAAVMPMPYEGDYVVGFIDFSGTMVIEPQFLYAFNFSEGLCAAWAGPGRVSDPVYGYIDRTGKMVVKQQFLQADPFSEGLAYVVLSNSDGMLEYGYVNHDDNVVFKRTRSCPPGGGMEADFGFHDGLAVSYDGHLFGYIDRAWRTAIPFGYVEAKPFHEGLALVMDLSWQQYTPGAYTYIDTTGRKVIRLKNILDGRSFSEGLASVKLRMSK